MGQYVQGVVFDSERMKREITSGAAATKLAEPTDDYARYLLDGDGGAREALGQLLAGGELTKQGDIFGLATMALCIEYGTLVRLGGDIPLMSALYVTGFFDLERDLGNSWPLEIPEIQSVMGATYSAEDCKAQLEEMRDLCGEIPPEKPAFGASDRDMAEYAARCWLQKAVEAEHSLLIVGM